MDTATGPVPVCKALKKTFSAHHHNNELHQAVPRLSEVWERVEFHNECNRGSTTAPVELTPPANKDVEHHVHVQLVNLDGPQTG